MFTSASTGAEATAKLAIFDDFDDILIFSWLHGCKG